jgi:Prokaryotic phospholipase A2
LRPLPRLAMLTIGVAAALTLAAPSSGPGKVDLGQVPADFAQVMGYQPAVARLADGKPRVINPRGSCSVPGEGRPFDFAVACQAHDYGYDLLRYAERAGHPLPPSAREEIDRRLSSDMMTQCGTDRSVKACDATAAVFTAGVTFNSWRQLFGPPDYDAGLTRTAGLALLVGVAGALGIRRRRRARRDRLTALTAGSDR